MNYLLSKLKSATWIAALGALLLSVNAQAQQQANSLSNIPVTGTVADTGGTALGPLKGSVSIQELSVNDQGELLASGVLRGDAAGQRINEKFSNAVVGLTQGEAVHQVVQQQTPGACDILFLDLGPLHLDVLGLVIDGWLASARSACSFTCSIYRNGPRHRADQPRVGWPQSAASSRPGKVHLRRRRIGAEWART